MPLWRAHAAMETLHPQWNGYGYTWRRDLNAIAPENYPHGDENERIWVTSPFYALMQRARAGEDTPEHAPAHRNRSGGARLSDSGGVLRAGRDGLFGATLRLRREGDRSQGTGIVYSFTTDRKGGFSDDDTTLVQATLPALSLAMKAHAGHVIASGLLGAYLGEDAGRRVHAGSIMRGSVDNLRAVIVVRRHSRLHAAQRHGAGPRRRRTAQRRVRDPDRVAPRARRPGAQVHRRRACSPSSRSKRRTGPRPAAARSTPRSRRCGNIEALNAARVSGRRARSPRSISRSILATCCTATSARSIGSTSRSSARRSTRRRASRRLCEPLGRAVLVSAEFVAGMTDADGRLKSLGRHALRGVKEPKEIFALDLGAAPA